MPQLRTARRAAMAALWIAVFVTGSAAHAESAWVRAEVRLNLRTGPSNEHRIVGGLQTGDEVKVVSRRQRWTQVSAADGKEGWIPAGYLSDEAPPTIRLQQLETENGELRARVSALEETNGRLEASSESFEDRDASQRNELDRLAIENRDLKAGARWPYLITGATILAAGMIVGAVMARSSGRRQSRRIRL